MSIKVNLVGASNFINNLDGIKYTSRNSAGALIDYEVTESQAETLLDEKSEFGVSYFVLAEGSDAVGNVAEGLDDELPNDSDGETDVVEEKKTVKKTVKIGGTKKAVEV